MNFDDFQQGTRLTVNPDINPDYVLAHWGMGLSGEAGEICDYLKKVVFHSHRLDINKLKDELGDLLFYLAQTADAVGLKLSEIARYNHEKLNARYPEGFSTEQSINREDD